jgi:hypothetical protein
MPVLREGRQVFHSRRLQGHDRSTYRSHCSVRNFPRTLHQSSCHVLSGSWCPIRQRAHYYLRSVDGDVRLYLAIGFVLRCWQFLRRLVRKAQHRMRRRNCALEGSIGGPAVLMW